MVSSTAVQGGTGAFSNIQSLTSAASVVIDLGGLAVPILLFVKNATPVTGVTLTDAANVIYVDTAAATTGSAIKLLPGQAAFISSALYTWHAIASGWTSTAVLLQVAAAAQ
jgi:hypothetical protein